LPPELAAALIDSDKDSELVDATTGEVFAIDEMHELPPVDRCFRCGDALDDTTAGDLCWQCEATASDTD
jgi:hypothetical protein